MTLTEFENWALSQGSVANPEPNFKYKGQCVSLIQQLLYLVLDIPFKARGNAKDWAYNSDVLSHFNKLSSNTNLQPGDILVYGANYGGGYGHMCFVTHDYKYCDQNGVVSLKIGKRDTPFSGYICVLRSKKGINIENETSFWVRVDKSEANVRKEPNTSSQTVPQPGALFLVKGDTFKAVATVEGENVGGNNIWYKSEKGNYVWSGGLTRI